MAKTYEPIATLAGTGASSIIFSSIPGTFTDLVLVMNGTASSDTNVFVELNGDTSNNYSVTAMTGDGSSASSYRNANYAALQSLFGYFGTAGGMVLGHFMSYANAAINKVVLARYNYVSNLTLAGVGLWRSNSAITSIKVKTSNSATFPTSTKFTLYGIKAA